MTRAKTTLTMTYSQTNDSGSDTIIASFLTNCTPTIIPTSDDPAEQIELAETDWTTRLTSPIVPELKDLLAPALETYKLSATHLNNFLDVSRGGPQNFLLNNLLHFPSAKNSAAAYGTAIHSSLQQAHCSSAPIINCQAPNKSSNSSKNPSRASICQRTIFNCIWTRGSRL